MKINKEHFRQTENAFLDLYRDNLVNGLTHFNYGLLSSQDSSFNLQLLNYQQGLMQIRLNSCRAITSGGVRIEITSANHSSLNSDGQLQAELNNPPKGEPLYLVILKADLFTRSPYGVPDPQEIPLRHPFTQPTYKLEIIPASQYNISDAGDVSIVAGKIKWQGNDLVLDSNFIPACTSISAHSRLIVSFNQLTGTLNEIENFSARIIQKIVAKNQKTTLAENSKNLMNLFLVFSAQNFFRMKQMPSMPPVYFIECFVQIANIFRVFLTTLSDKDKEEMITYYSNWTSLQQGKLEGMINETVNIDYYHPDIYPAMILVEQFTSTLHTLLSKLSNLEFVGTPPQGSEWIIQEKQVKTEAPKPKGWSTF